MRWTVYFSVLLPRLRRLQWTEGGPVVLMQIENEYGSVGNDTRYLRHLYDLFRDSGITIPLFISDWGSATVMYSGSIPETLLTVNCPSHPGPFLDEMQKLRPETPEFVMELWSGVSHRWNAPTCAMERKTWFRMSRRCFSAATPSISICFTAAPVSVS